MLRLIFLLCVFFFFIVSDPFCLNRLDEIHIHKYHWLQTLKIFFALAEWRFVTLLSSISISMVALLKAGSLLMIIVIFEYLTLRLPCMQLNLRLRYPRFKLITFYRQRRQ